MNLSLPSLKAEGKEEREDDAETKPSIKEHLIFTHHPLNPPPERAVIVNITHEKGRAKK